MLGEVWNCGGKLPTSSKEARNEEIVLAFFLVEGGVVVIRAESGLDESTRSRPLQDRSVTHVYCSYGSQLFEAAPP